jgi:hypothetical protein
MAPLPPAVWLHVVVSGATLAYFLKAKQLQEKNKTSFTIVSEKKSQD